MRKGMLLSGALLFLFVSALAVAGEQDRGWLGVTLTQQMKIHDGEAADTGIKILSIMPDSAAGEAGLLSGDVIIEFDGEALEGIDDLIDRLRPTAQGDIVRLTVLRDGEETDFDVELGRRPESHELKGLKSLDNLKHLEHLKHLQCVIKEKVRGLHKTKEVNKGYLGVHIQNLTPDLQRFFGSDDDRGVLISKVLEHSPADYVGLEVGDVITEVNGEGMDSTGELQRAIAKLKKGDVAQMTILRHEREINIAVAIDEKKSKSIICVEEEDE